MIRVFLTTCRRPALLPRALASLRAQTYTDWICELHNDAPEDDGPLQLVEQAADSRIILCQHEQNWGPVRMFNHVFTGGPEPSLSLLEDDNWWEPDFLAKAVAALEANPSVNVVWANMRIWREDIGGRWTDTGRTIWQRPAQGDTPPPRLFQWPNPLQCFDGLHSNGAMLVRAAVSRQALVPPLLPFAIIEPARERLLPGDWLLLPEPLGNYALTRSTARNEDRTGWMQSQLLVAASYLAAVPMTPAQFAELWQYLRSQTPPAVSLLFHLAFAGVQPVALLRHARFNEWLRFLAGVIAHPVNFLRCQRFRSVHIDTWRALLAGAKARSTEVRDLQHQPLWSKSFTS